MHEFVWMDHLPGNQLQGGIDLANRLLWHVEWRVADGQWVVLSGERALLISDSKEVAEAFLYGLGLAYAVFPDWLFDQLEAEVKGCAE